MTGGRLAGLRLRRLARTKVVTSALALVAAGLTMTVVLRAESISDTYGVTTAVGMARAVVEPGETIDPGDIEVREVPIAILPDDIEADPVGRVARETIYPGEPIPTSRLAPEGSNETTALVPPGHRALAIPVDVPAPHLEAGDLVDLFGGTDTTRVARDLRVVTVDEDAVTVVVEDRTLGVVARAMVEAPIIIVVSGTG